MSRPYSNSLRNEVSTGDDVLVQGTNDSSIVSKLSMVDRGYFVDDYVQYFVAKRCRRSPIINRGYYIRAAAINHTLTSFLKVFGQSANQIISLGAGFDSTFFRLASQNLLGNTVYIEIDFRELLLRKCRLIESCETLLKLVGDPVNVHSAENIDFIVLNTEQLKLLGVDLTRPDLLTRSLEVAGIDFSRPTLLLSEVVITYLTPDCSCNVIQWAASQFNNSLFVCYEQIRPSDSFGIFMCQHFRSLGSPLRSIETFPSIESQVNKYISLGWCNVVASDMNFYYQSVLSVAERHRVETLEPFDEFEEFHMKCSHYILLTAFNGNCMTAALTEIWPTYSDCRPDFIINNGIFVSSTAESHSSAQTVAAVKCSENEFSAESNAVNRKETFVTVHVKFLSSSAAVQCQRFGHTATRLVLDTAGLTGIAVVGGFGMSDTGSHGRLAGINVCRLDKDSVVDLEIKGEDVEGLECLAGHVRHTATLINDHRLLVIGGRVSPVKPVHHFVVAVDFMEMSAPNMPASGATEPVLNMTVSMSVPNEPASGANEPVLNESVPMSAPNKPASGATEPVLNESVPMSAPNKPASGATEPVLNESVLISAPNMPAFIATEPVLMSAANDSLRMSNKRLKCSIIEMSGDVPSHRWRHTCTSVNINGTCNVFLFGGRNAVQSANNNCYLLNCTTLTWTKIKCEADCLPEPRHSHSADLWRSKVIVAGGLSHDLRPVNSVYSFCTETVQWTRLTVYPEIIARYSHSSAVYRDHLILVGGVSLNCPSPGVEVVNLLTLESRRCDLPCTSPESLFMFHNHTCVVGAPDDITTSDDVTELELLVLGGGGNCFSFGTHFNSRPVFLSLRFCV